MEREEKKCEIGQNIIMKKGASLDKKVRDWTIKKGASLGNRVEPKKGARLGKNGARLGTSRCFSAVSGPGRLLVVFLAEWSASSLLLSYRQGGGVPGV